MKWICLLLPACVSMKIRYRRNQNLLKADNTLLGILRWGSWILVNNMLSMFTIVYVLRMGTVVTDVFNSFNFSLKYMVISLVFACVLPYVLEIVEKYISISFTVGETEETESKEK